MDAQFLVIGEALIDIVARHAESPVEHVGGSPANVAVGLARLDNAVRFNTCLGDDARGERIRTHLRHRGVHVIDGTDDHPTSTAQANIDESGAASYVFNLFWDPGHIELPESVGHIHTGSIAAVLEPGGTEILDALDRGRAQATVSYDPNFRSSIMGDVDAAKARIEDVIGRSDVVKASSDDVAIMYPDLSLEQVLAHWIDLGPALAVITRAEDGVTFQIAGAEPVTRPAPPTTVVDTVGAGDSFMAGLVSGLHTLGLLGSPEARERLYAASPADVEPAIERGALCGAMTVSRAGAYAPSLDEL